MFRVGGGDSGSAGAELRALGRGAARGRGFRRPRRARADPGGVALTGDDEGLGVSRPGHCTLRPAAPQPSRVIDAAPATSATGEAGESLRGGRRRRRAGTRPAPRPDAQFGSSLRREGGRAARAVGKCSLGAT